jgi:hypothetical protein
MYLSRAQVPLRKGRSGTAQVRSKQLSQTYDTLHWVNTSAVESVNSFLKGFWSLDWYSGLESFIVILPILLGGYNQTLKRVDDAKLSIAIAAAVWAAGIPKRLLLG